MKLPDYSVGNGQENLEYSKFSHNSPIAVAFNPNPPSKMPMSYPHGEAAERKMKKIRHEYKTGELNIGKSEKKVTNPKQMVAIMLSEGRRTEKESRKRKK